MDEIRLLIAGSRTFTDYQTLKEITDAAIREIKEKYRHTRIVIVTGGADGTDEAAIHYALKSGYPYKVFLPDWKQYGRAAGPIRNKEMLNYILEGIPYLLAFWNGESRGTKNMINITEKAGVPITVVRYIEKRE